MKKVALVAVAMLSAFNLSSAGAYAQTGSQEPAQGSVRLRSTEVLVDAVVVDHKNRLVGNLAPKDFAVYEDGVQQEITSFRVVHGAAEPDRGKEAKTAQQTTRREPAKSDSTLYTSGEEPPNLIVVLLDYSTTEFRNKKQVQDAAIKYVEKRMQPNDLMAVFVLGASLRVASEFTNDKATLIAALKKSDLTGTALASDRADMSKTIDEGNSPENQPSSQPISGGPGASAAGSSQAARMIAQRYADMVVSMRASVDRLQTLGVLSAIRAIAIGLREIEGRKTLLLFSQGFIVSPAVEDNLRLAAGIANRSNLAVYCIESQGLETRELKAGIAPKDALTEAAAQPQSRRITAFGGESNFDRSLQVGEDLRDRALAYIADSTGGSLIRDTNDLASGLYRIDEEMRTYYLLSYVPKDAALDGRFRQIRVTVDKPELKVRARSGYYAMPAGYDLLSPAEYQLVQETAKPGPNSSRIPLFMRASAFLYGVGEYRVPVAVEIPYTSIRFDSEKGKHSAEMLFFGIVRDAAGKLIRRFGDPVQMSLSDAEYNRLKVGTISLTNEVRLPPDNQYTVQVFVKDLGSGLVSDVRQNLDLRQPTSGFGLSSVLLANGRELFRTSDKTDTFLTVQGVKLLPSAACQFRNGDNLVFYFDIDNPPVDPESKKTDLSIKLSFTQSGKEIKAGLPSFHLNDNPTGSIPHITFCRFLHLTGLNPGTYSLVVNVKDGTGTQEAQREATFTVLR